MKLRLHVDGKRKGIVVVEAPPQMRSLMVYGNMGVKPMYVPMPYIQFIIRYQKIKNQLKEEEQTDITNFQDMVGKAFFFRTVTYHLVGKVTKIIGNFLQLETASWVVSSSFPQSVDNLCIAVLRQ